MGCALQRGSSLAFASRSLPCSDCSIKLAALSRVVSGLMTVSVFLQVFWPTDYVMVEVSVLANSKVSVSNQR